jgi:hypothetical protein
MAWPRPIVRDGVTYTIAPYPAQLKNPAGLRAAIYREGKLCGVARTQKEAVNRIRSGRYDPPDTQEEDIDDGEPEDDR